MNSDKYNRTYHLPWSKGATNDDKVNHNLTNLINNPIVITAKLDGSNVCLESNNCFARTHSSAPDHPSFDAFKSLHASVKHIIPDNMSIFGEWLYALHSIKYENLPHYLALFGIRNNVTKTWSSWDEVIAWAEWLNIPTVPVLFSGVINSEKELKAITTDLMTVPIKYGEVEGLVIRVVSRFNDSEFSTSVNKMVRPNHVQSTEHWRHKEIVKNKLYNNI